MSMYGMYGVDGRDEKWEIKERYDAMVNVLSDILGCGRWDIETLFDSKNNIEVGDIVKRYVEECGCLPNNNTVYYEAMLDFANEHNLEPGVDIDIYTNSCLDTHIYVREDLDENIVDEFEKLFNLEAGIMSK